MHKCTNESWFNPDLAEFLPMAVSITLRINVSNMSPCCSFSLINILQNVRPCCGEGGGGDSEAWSGGGKEVKDLQSICFTSLMYSHSLC